MKLAISVVVIMQMFSQLLAVQESFNLCSDSNFYVTVDNKLAEIYIDGVQVQYTQENTYKWGRTNKVQVPGSARVIAIKAENPGLVVAGILGSGASSTTDGSWKCTNVGYSRWAEVRFDDSAWPAAKVNGSNGIAPWGTVSGIGVSAKWIWTEARSERPGEVLDRTVFCRKKRDCDQGTGLACIISCSGRTNGNYQSCKGCNIYATCSNGILYDDIPCASSEQFWDDNLKRCGWIRSDTCVKVV